MSPKTKELAENILDFVTDESVIKYLNQIEEYGKFIIEISKTHSLDAVEIDNNPELEKTYNEHRERISSAFKDLNNALNSRGLDRSSLLMFYKKGETIIKDEYADYIDFIGIIRFFAALIRNHKNDKLKMTLAERFKDLKKIGISERQMEIAELISLKKHSKIIELHAQKIS